MKTIWITGGSSGIGAATAEKFNKENWRVIISARKLEQLKTTRDKIINQSNNKEVYLLPCDITNRDEVHEVVRTIENKISKIDIALLNAAAYSPNKLQKFDINNFDVSIDVNLKGTLYCIEILEKIMSVRKSGHISIVSSPVGYRGLPTAPAYGMTKAALINLAESLFFDFKKLGIKITVINPGFIESKSTNLNNFSMPFIKSASYAGEKIFDGLTKSNKFEIIFPLIFLRLLKIFRILPYPIYFYLVRKITGL